MVYCVNDQNRWFHTFHSPLKM